MLNKTTLTTLALTSLLLTACNDSDKPDPAKFSLGVSDAPVENAEIVNIEIDRITLTNSNNQQQVVIEEFSNGDNVDPVDTIQVNLLDFTGIQQLKIVDEAQGITLEQGTYTMELTIIDEGSHVILKGDPKSTEYDIKVPSSRLRLGEFVVNSEAVQVEDTPAYTVEFDLTQSLVLRGNDPAKNGYIIKPHGVRIVSLYGAIEGNVTPDGPCMVYLYQGNATEFADLFDSNAGNFIGEAPATASAPLAATNVVDGLYSIGFVPEGDYTVALRCNNEIDDNVQYDILTIPSPAGNSQAITVNAGFTSPADF